MKKSTKILLISIIIILVAFGTYLTIPKHNVFVKGPDMSIPMEDHHGVLLNDGNVLLIGNYKMGELFVPSRRKIYTVGEMRESKLHYSATLLNDGKVLIAGGSGNKNKPFKQTEFYNPKTYLFEKGPDLNFAREKHTATLLKDGRVLIVGGSFFDYQKGKSYFVKNVEIYNPKTNKFEIGPKMLYPRTEHRAILLKDGCVLVIGGKPHVAELYDPKINKFVKIKNMNYPAYFLQTATLNDGRVLIVTGSKHGEVIEVFDPDKREFSVLLDKIPDKSPSSTMTVLKNGNVLFTGGYKKENWYVIETKESLIFNSINKQFIKGPNLKIKRGGHVATLLNDGTIFITGGNSASPGTKIELRTELYIP